MGELYAICYKIKQTLTVYMLSDINGGHSGEADGAAVSYGIEVKYW